MKDQSHTTYVCRGDRKNTYLAFFVFLGLAVLGMLAAALHLTSEVIAQAIAFIAFIVAAYIFIRFIATVYRYELIAEEEGDYLLIIRIQGKKEFTQRKSALSCLAAIYTVDTARGIKPEHPKLPLFNYSSHLFAESYTLLQFEGEDPALFRINADDAFLEALAAYLPKEEASKEYPEENDND